MRFLAGVVLVLVPVLAAGQSLGDAAQKERERRQKLKESGASAPVITEEALKANKGNLANDPGAAVASPAGSSESPAAQRTNPAPKATPRPPAVRTGPPVVSEQEFRGRSIEARRLIAERQRRYDYLAGLRLAPDQPFTDEGGNSVPATPENVERARAAAQDALDKAKRDFEDLQEEARRQNVPPGIVR